MSIILNEDLCALFSSCRNAKLGRSQLWIGRARADFALRSSTDMKWKLFDDTANREAVCVSRGGALR